MAFQTFSLILELELEKDTENYLTGLLDHMWSFGGNRFFFHIL